MKCKYCEKKAVGRGMCQTHYTRWSRAGKPEEFDGKANIKLTKEEFHATITRLVGKGTTFEKLLRDLVETGYAKKTAKRYVETLLRDKKLKKLIVCQRHRSVEDTVL